MGEGGRIRLGQLWLGWSGRIEKGAAWVVGWVLDGLGLSGRGGRFRGRADWVVIRAAFGILLSGHR